jgi:integrase
MKLRGSIENRNGKYSLRYSVIGADGSRNYKRVALEATTRKDAQREAARLSASLPAHANSTYTFADFIGDLSLPASARKSLWQDYLNGRQVQESTQNVYNMMARYFVEAMGSKDVTAITPADITALLQSLRERISQGSLVVAYRALTLMFRVLLDHDRIAKTPVRKTLHVVSKPKTKKPSLSLEQFQQLLQVIDPVLKLPVLIMGITGLRQSEAFGLQWRDFDGAALHISGKVYRRQREESVKTESTARKILLPAEVVSLLLHHRAETSWSLPQDFIFAARDGRAPNSELYRYKYLWPALQAVGVPITKHAAGYHIIRHSVGRIAYEMTRDPKAVQMLLGHAVIATTMNTYCHPDASVPGAVANRIYQEVSSYVN